MSEKLSNVMNRYLMNYLKGGYDVILPNFFFGWNECDVFRINQKNFVYEYEIKISRQDFFNDTKKQTRDGLKYDMLKGAIGDYCPNRFFYVVPADLISVTEIPKFAGLIYFKKTFNSFCIIKAAPLLHKREICYNIYRDVCRTLATRDFEYRKKIKKIRGGEFDRQLAESKREIDSLKTKVREYSNELFLLKVGTKRQPI